MKNTALTLVTIASIIALQGCGGGAGDASPTTTIPKYTAVAGCTPSIVTVALLGDSTQYGADSGNSLALAVHNPGAELQSMMNRYFGAGAVAVTDYGVPGTTAPQAPHVSADVVVANYGINDAKTGEDLATFVAAMKAIGATLIETPNPVYGNTWDDTVYAAADATLGLPIADVHAYVLLPQTDGELREHDGVHPDDDLYIDIVDNVLTPAVAAQVAPLRCLKE